MILFVTRLPSAKPRCCPRRPTTRPSASEVGPAGRRRAPAQWKPETAPLAVRDGGGGGGSISLLVVGSTFVYI